MQYGKCFGRIEDNGKRQLDHGTDSSLLLKLGLWMDVFDDFIYFINSKDNHPVGGVWIRSTKDLKLFESSSVKASCQHRLYQALNQRPERAGEDSKVYSTNSYQQTEEETRQDNGPSHING